MRRSPSWAAERLPAREARLFDRMAERASIEHRWSVLDRPPLEPGGFYAGDPPPTSARMAVYAAHAPALAEAAVRDLGDAFDPAAVTHLVVASCTGFVAPGLDQLLAARLGLGDRVERLLVGFMGCYAAVGGAASGGDDRARPIQPPMCWW